MKTVCSILNLAIVAMTFELLAVLLFTYNSPLTDGCVWIALVGLRSLAEVFRK